MMLDFACTGCGQKYRVDIGLSGRKIRCKKCGEAVTVPSPNAVAPTPRTVAAATKPASRPPLRSFGDNSGPQPAASRPSQPAAQRPSKPTDEEEYDYDLTDAEEPDQGVSDPYGMDDEYAPPISSADEVATDYDDELAMPGRPGRPGSGKSSKLQTAGVWKRLCSALADFFLIGLMQLAATFVVFFCIGLYYGLMLKLRTSPDELNGFEAPWRVVMAVFFFLYFTMMNSSSNQGTLGKIGMKIKVTDMDGRPISFLRSAARTLASYLSLFTLGIGFFIAIFNDKKRTLHDLIAGTRVVMK